MTKLQGCRALFLASVESVLFGLLFSSFVYGQNVSQDQELEVQHLPSFVVRSQEPHNVLRTSLDTIIHDRAVCCGKDSALEDSVLAADPKSLKDVANKLEGRHLLSDGRPIIVTTEYLPAAQAGSGHLITMILNQHAALVDWNSRLYVVHGVGYVWEGYSIPDGGGGTMAVMRRLLLWDTRFSDSRREVVFSPYTDDVSKVQGFLFVDVKLQ
jgi:hypothetical protein